MPALATASIDNAVVFALSVRRPGLRRKGSLDDLATDADKTRLHLSKEILQAAEFNAIANWDRQLINLVHSRTLPFPFKRGHGIHLLPVDLIDWVERSIALFLPARQDLIDAFIDAYPLRVNEARQALGSQFRQQDYPDETALRESFSVEVQMLELRAPEVLRQRNPAVFAREEARLAAQLTEASELAYDQLKSELTSLITNENGKPKAVRAAMLENLDDWIGVFAARNLFGADDLAALVSRIQAVLKETQPSEVRGNTALSQQIQDGLAEVAQALDALPSQPNARAPRKLRLVDPEPAAVAD